MRTYVEERCRAGWRRGSESQRTWSQDSSGSLSGIRGAAGTRFTWPAGEDLGGPVPERWLGGGPGQDVAHLGAARARSNPPPVGG